MAKEKKFIPLVESYMRRYKRGGFLVGDVFKFNDNFKSEEGYRDLGQNVKDLIDQMIESGLHIRVVGIKNEDPSRFPGSEANSQLEVFLDIALDTGGGRYTHYCAIPTSLGQPVHYAPNLLPIPDAMRHKSKVNIKPEEVVEDEESVQNKTDRGDGKLTQTELKLPTQNTTLPNASEPYTANYLQGLQ